MEIKVKGYLIIDMMKDEDREGDTIILYHKKHEIKRYRFIDDRLRLVEIIYPCKIREIGEPTIKVTSLNVLKDKIKLIKI